MNQAARTNGRRGVLSEGAGHGDSNASFLGLDKCLKIILEFRV